MAIGQADAADLDRVERVVRARERAGRAATRPPSRRRSTPGGSGRARSGDAARHARPSRRTRGKRSARSCSRCLARVRAASRLADVGREPRGAQRAGDERRRVPRRGGSRSTGPDDRPRSAPPPAAPASGTRAGWRRSAPRNGCRTRSVRHRQARTRSAAGQGRPAPRTRSPPGQLQRRLVQEPSNRPRTHRAPRGLPRGRAKRHRPDVACVTLRERCPLGDTTVLLDKRLELGDESGSWRPSAEVGLNSKLERARLSFFEEGALALCEVVVDEVHQRRAAPQRQGVAGHGRGRVCIPSASKRRPSAARRSNRTASTASESIRKGYPAAAVTTR